jgi:hypothetical protein
MDFKKYGAIAWVLYCRYRRVGQGMTAYEVAKFHGISRYKAQKAISGMAHCGLLNVRTVEHRHGTKNSRPVYKNLYSVNPSGEMFLVSMGYNVDGRFPL